MKVYICDDDEAFTAELDKKVKSIFDSYSVLAETVTFNSSLSLIRLLKSGGEIPDVLFLDIDMPSMTGFDVASEIKKDFKSVIIVFVSNKQELVYDSFEFQPLSFVRKSRADQLDHDLGKVSSMIMSVLIQNRIVEIHDIYSGLSPVPVNRILYIKSDNHYLLYTLCEGRALKERKAIKTADDEFRELGFIRPHNRYLVNLAHISFFNPSFNRIILDTKEAVPVSRSLKDSSHKEYLKYKREH